ncbi:TonB-dependent receptor plug domain-containing protein [Halioglobus pacificus]|uniref:TonB-dependent receptor n=1 Tax=Parahalioglobus pacificus TaxID=930806 RepID=A0A919CLP5_9GAMM|nr:TonB-dependent receptor [Halioglobus pacificus]GHD35243.1 TonB-dependent receptor [Halioglobus pacificus]
MKTNKLTSAVRLAIGAGAVTATMPVAQLATAQEQMIEEVVITGSRIRRPDLEAVSPYTTVDAEEFQLSGTINVEQKLNELPQTLPAFGPSSNNPGDGTARVDLRGLGSSRTLVLVNGRRWIPATQTGVVDLNSIPGTLIKRVDVVTGGASAVYGSDALAGVVNFEMIDDFEGAQITGLYDITDEGDAEKYNMDITMGGNFADGRGNAVVYASYSKREALFQGDRSFSDVALVESGDRLVPGGSSGVPGTRIFGGPAVPGAGFDLGTFGPNGEALPWIEPDSRFNYAPDNFLQLPQERYLVSSFAHYDVNEHVRTYGEFAYSYNKVPQELAPTPAFTTVEINPNSAFLSADAQAALNGAVNEDGESLLNDDGNYVAFIGRRMVENGSRQSIDVRDAFRVLVGVDGDINDNWSYDAYYSLSNLDNSNALNNDVSASRFIQAVATNDAGTACQDPSGGCVPLNIFGAGNISQEAIDFVNIGATNITSIEQEVIQASVFGDLFTLPTAEYPVSVVLGYEHRRDESSFRPDTFLASGDVLGFNAGEPTIGSYKATEFFGEVSVPLLQGAPLAEDLTLWGAARTSDYSNLDDRVNSFATAINYAPIESVKFRLGYQEAVRAPNVSELFGGNANGFPGADDPCSAGGFQPGVTNSDLCVATGVAASQVGNFTQANSQIEGRFGGNPDLTEETSNTYTAGVVWQPTDSLDITIDYYDIEIEDAISVLGGSVTNVLDLCYNVIQNAGSAFCQAVNRRADGNVDFVNVLNANIGTIETSGVDFNVYYSTDFGFGIGGNGSTLDISLNGTYLDEYDVTPVAELSDRVDVCAGNFGNTCGNPLPEILVNTRATLRTGAWTFSGLLRYIGETDDDQIENAGATDLVVPTIDDEYYLDLTVSYAFEQGLTLSFGGLNVLDTEPTALGDSQQQANTFPETYSLFGPRYFLSASYTF